MAWIESHQSLANHPKTLKLASLLGIGIPQVIGHLHLLWYWALDYAEDGDITDGADTLNIICQWPGTNGQFRQALMDAKFLDSDLKLHNWPIYTGQLIEKRKQQREAKRLGGLARAEIASRDQQGRYVSPAMSQQEVQQTVQQETSRTQLTNQPTNRNQPTNQPRGASKKPQPLPAFEVPDDFKPLTELPGYKPKNYEKSFANVKAACADANVDVADVVSQFAADYRDLRHEYAWTDPVAVFKKKPLAIAISKVLEGGYNGRRRSATQRGGNSPKDEGKLSVWDIEKLRLEGKLPPEQPKGPSVWDIEAKRVAEP